MIYNTIKTEQNIKYFVQKMAPKPRRRRIKTKKLKNQLQNEISTDVAEFDEKCSSDDGIINDIIFSNGLRDAEHEIMKLYQETFIHPLDRSHTLLTRDEEIERSAQNMAFWQKLLREYDENDFDPCTSNPRYYYMKMKEAEVRVNIFLKKLRIINLCLKYL